MSAWTTSDLATDDDLAAQDSLMPGLAKRVLNEGRSAYDGKRALAKRDIGSRLRRLGYSLDGILTPSDFNRAAVFLELALIYQDMARGQNAISAEKSTKYWSLYSEEIEGIQFDYCAPSTADTEAPQTKPIVLLWRA